MVVESYGAKFKNSLPFPVVAIYPKEGTFLSDHPVGIVHREWVTPAHREAAEKYMAFLLEKPQQEKALKYGFRPGLESVELTSPITKEFGVDPSQPRGELQMPSPQVMAAALKLWRGQKNTPKW